MASKHTRDMDKIYSKYRAFEPVKQKSYYPSGRKKGAALKENTEAYRDGWDRIFGKKQEPGDFDERT